MPQGKPLRSFGMQKSTISTEFRTFRSMRGMCSERNGLHLVEDHILVEVINPDTLEPVAEGERGELVFTTLRKTARPMIRFRTGDIGTVNREKCACGRTHARINITGRLDDMLIVSGVNVFPVILSMLYATWKNFRENTGLLP